MTKEAETPDFEQMVQRMADALYVTDTEGSRPRTDIEPVIMTRDWYIEQLRVAWQAGVEAGRRESDLKPCECGCGRLSPGGRLEAIHAEDYRSERG